MIETLINNPKEVPDSTIRAIVAAGRTPTIQFSEPGYSPELLRAVNRLCIEYGDKLEVRFYGHYGSKFDALALVNIPSVSYLSINCLMEIENEQEISNLTQLRRLSFGVYKFDNSRFLDQINVTNLTNLGLIENSKRNLDLAPLSRATSLATLYLNGHTKNIDALSKLPELRHLTLSGIPKNQSLKFVCGIRNLSALSILLGGRQSIDELMHPKLEQLSVIRVRGLEGIGSLARFPCLRELQVEDQLQINSINLAGAVLLKVSLMNCKNLEEVEGLAALSELVAFRTGRTKLDLKPLLEREWPPSLKVLALYSSSQKWNDAARAILDRRGYQEFSSHQHG